MGLKGYDDWEIGYWAPVPGFFLIGATVVYICCIYNVQDEAPKANTGKSGKKAAQSPKKTRPEIISDARAAYVARRNDTRVQEAIQNNSNSWLKGHKAAEVAHDIVHPEEKLQDKLNQL